MSGKGRRDPKLIWSCEGLRCVAGEWVERGTDRERHANSLLDVATELLNAWVGVFPCLRDVLFCMWGIKEVKGNFFFD